MTTTAQVANFWLPTNLTTAAQTLYTVPSSPNTGAFARGRIRFTNYDGSNHTVTAYGVESGSLPANRNTFIAGETVNANSHLDTDIPVLGPGMYLSALASSNGVVNAQIIDGILFS